MNLACSGAKTSTFTTAKRFKPGLDFYNSGGTQGQALMLQDFAASHNVKLVAVLDRRQQLQLRRDRAGLRRDWLTSP